MCTLTRSFRVSFRIRFCTACCQIRTQTLWSSRIVGGTRRSWDSDGAERPRLFVHMCSSSNRTPTCGHVYVYCHIKTANRYKWHNIILIVRQLVY